MLRGRADAYHRAGLVIPLAVGTLAALLQPVSGDFNGRNVAEYQPAKLAAMEALFETRSGAPLLIGGIPDPASGQVSYAVEIPYGLSLLAKHDPDAVIKGLNEFPADERPDVLWVHLAFQVMVGCGFALLALGAWFWWSHWRKGEYSRRLLQALVVGSPLGFLALEAGWFVTEVGRQPWTIYGVMKTADAATPAVDVPSSFLAFTALYIALAVTVILLLLRLSKVMPTAGSAARH
jgi:cytochrome d ubiquinol oxidase subunit I